MLDQKQFWTFIIEALPELRDFWKNPDNDSPVYQEIRTFLNSLLGEEEGGRNFLTKAAGLIKKEWEQMKDLDPDLLSRAGELMQTPEDTEPEQKEQALLQFLFPESLFAGGGKEEQIEAVRTKRTVSVSALNPDPVRNPAEEIIFTSNVLLTIPPEKNYAKLDSSLRERVGKVASEKQKFWFDHPILMGVDTQANEMIYGLKGLSEALKYEKSKGNAAADAEMTVVLSLSVTHEGLKDLAHEYLSGELKKTGSLEGLKVYLFTEEDTEFLVNRLSELSDLPEAAEAIGRVFGVDGRYGRHYSFLKAVAPLWALTVDERIKGTFKIDLDQVFPQMELYEQTGKTAFQHLSTPLWGASGVDSKGRPVYLGMIAGALVNEKDISRGIYTPDVPFPEEGAARSGETRIFEKQKVMAASTRGEMMTRYGDSDFPDHPDGKTACLSRVHVTGGTNGILCDTLRKYRPFTPAFIGRAEDQGYILSVLLGQPGSLENEPFLRYVHEAGLIMRHDKEAFAGDSIAAAKLGTWIGDLLRQLYFSYYARFLPGGIAVVKEELDPFTGCFISSCPLTMIFLRLVLKILCEPENGRVLLDLAENRLGSFVNAEETPGTVKSDWIREKDGWDLYYDCLDLLESGLTVKDQDVLETSDTIRQRIEGCRIS